ncbi:MAG: undecaprenyl/decaprenyl-phosphate alpha-N-acetylglucosaminyl 1-phosphate transferase [Chloroflexi bacterium]|nr:undecaprenyl/decaprenyl-phosphate alpha-N-acetylglucosaminyl 1-phosphate transferase [Chloroflexota bacterium]
MSREVALVIVLAVAWVVAFLLTFGAKAFGHWSGIEDKPRPGEVQKRIVPRTGGYAIFFGFLAAALVGAYLIPRSSQESWRLLGVLLGAAAVLPLAFMDDRRRLDPMPQLLGQFAIAAIPIAFGVVVDSIATPFGRVIQLPVWLVIPFTLLWIVGMINTINLVDVMDGLAGGVATIAALVLFARGVFDFGQYDIAILPLALAGACLGFLPHNFHPARVFMGSSGALLIGYALATMSIMGGAKVATALLVLGVPVADVAWVITRRLAAGRSPMKGGDQAHLPQRLHRAGLSQRQIVLTFYLLCAVFGVAAARFTPVQKIYAFVAVVAVMAVILVALARTERRSS